MNETQVRQFIEKSRKAGVPDEQILAYLQEKGVGTQTPTTEPAKPKYSSGVEDQGNFGKNVVNSGKEFGKGIAQVILNPIDTVKNIAGLGVGAIDLALGDGEGKNAEKAKAVGRYYKDRYGGAGEIANTLYTDPVGALADISTVAAGGAGLAKGAATVSKSTTASRVAQGASKVSRYTDPLNIAGAGIKKGAEASKINKVVTTVKEAPGRAIDKVRDATAGIDEPLEAVVTRRKPGESTSVTAARKANEYQTDVNRMQAHIKDPNKADHAVDIVAQEKIGGAYDKVITKTREVGAKIGELVDKNKNKIDIGDIRKDFLMKLRKDANVDIVKAKDGYRVQPLDKELGYKLNQGERELMATFIADLNDLGQNPSISKLSQFKKETRATLKQLKDTKKLSETKYFDTLANKAYDLIAKKLEANVEGLADLNREYSKNKGILKKAEKLGMGVETVNGEYARAGSMAKSVAKSFHSKDAKDFLRELEKITGDDILDRLSIAVRAAEDAGDYKIRSLLEELSTEGEKTIRAGRTPTAAATDLMGRAVSYAGEKAADIVSGTRPERTLRYIKNTDEAARNVAKTAKEVKKKVDTKTRKVLGNTVGLRNLTKRSSIDKATRYQNEQATDE